MFQTKVVEKMKTHILCSITFFSRKSIRLCDKVEECCRVGQTTNNNVAHAQCMLDNKTTNTHSEHVTLIVFPLQQ